jgi:hypothetical protein
MRWEVWERRQIVEKHRKGRLGPDGLGHGCSSILIPTSQPSYANVFGLGSDIDWTVTLPSCRLDLSEDLLWFDFAFKHIAKLQLLSLCVVSLGVKASNGFADRHRQTPPCELEQSK